MNAMYVIALGNVDGEALAAIELCLWRAFGVEVRRLPPIHQPVRAYNAQRGQYSSVEVLRALTGMVPPDGIRLLGVTEKDLFIPMLSFVFGQAQVNGKLAVLSLARLRQEFYGLAPQGALLQARAIKEAVHEIGHTFGLTHCTDTSCPMSLSNNVRQVDHKGEEFCRNCSIMLEEHTQHIRTGNGPGEKQ